MARCRVPAKEAGKGLCTKGSAGALAPSHPPGYFCFLVFCVRPVQHPGPHLLRRGCPSQGESAHTSRRVPFIYKPTHPKPTLHITSSLCLIPCPHHSRARYGQLESPGPNAAGTARIGQSWAGLACLPTLHHKSTTKAPPTPSPHSICSAGLALPVRPCPSWEL